MKKFSIVLLFLIVNAVALFSASFKELKAGEDLYYVRLVTGDELIGMITEIISSQEEKDGIKIKTEIGIATVYDFQVAEIIPFKEFYRQNNRVFFLPTAEPIGKNHYIANYELLFMNIGFGLADIVSITAGTTLLPIRETNNITNLNIKATVLEEEYASKDGKMSLAVGMNYASADEANYFLHFFGAATFRGDRSSLSLNLFYKAGNKDVTAMKFDGSNFFANYPNGSFGLGVGLDTRFTNMKNLHFIGELWNSDITRPTNTGVLLGLRLANTRFSADFGLAIFTQPFVAPFTQFSWTPF